MVESAELRLQQLGMLDKKNPAEWAKRFISQAHPDWSITDAAFGNGARARFFVVLGDPAEDNASQFEYDWIEVKIGDRNFVLKFSSSRHGDLDDARILQLPGPPATSLELGRLIAASFEDFARDRGLVQESGAGFNRLRQLNLAPSGNFVDLLTSMVEKAHPDWGVIARSIDRSIYVMPDWQVPVDITFAVDHSFAGDDQEPDLHLTVIEPIDEAHRIKIKKIELVSRPGEYSPWTEAKRTLARIEEWVRLTTEKYLASNK